MIYRVEVSLDLIAEHFHTGKVIPKTRVTKGLPPGARFFHAHPSTRGSWMLMFEGKPLAGEDVEGHIEDVRVEYTSIYGDVPLPFPEEG